MEKLKNPLQRVYEKCSNGLMSEKIVSLPNFPRMVDVELTNRCNYKCVMCPTGQGKIDRPKGDMSKDIIRKVLDELGKHKTPVRYIRWGEPMLAKNFMYAVVAAKSRGILCHVNTNGSLLDKGMAHFLIDSGLDSIKFSFQGANAKGYKEFRIENVFDDLIGKIKHLYRLRRQEKKSNPFIQVGTTVTSEPESIIQSFREGFEKIADAVYVSKTMDLQEKRDVRTLCECPEVFDKLSVDWDGTVTACCGDYDNHMVVGDIRENTLESIWASEKMADIRKKLSEYRHEDFYLCARCARSTDNEVR